MTEIHAFRGLRYGGADLSGRLAPPYDIVSPEKQAELIAQNENNILAVDNPAAGIPEDGERENAYREAGSILHTWLRNGVLIQESEPALYVIAHEFPDVEGGGSRTRLGLIGLLPALPWEQSSVRPHERTFKGPKEDRLRLMRATDAQTSPIFVMWNGAPGLSEFMAEVMSAPADAHADFPGEAGLERLALWSVTADDVVHRFKQAVADASLYMADGHHRYETAVAFAGEVAASAERPAVLTYLADAEDSGMCLLATHRLIRLGGAAENFFEGAFARLGERWTWSPIPTGTRAPAAPDRVDGRHTFVVVTGSGSFLLSRDVRDTESPREALDVAVLHDEILPVLAAGDESKVWFERDSTAAVESVRAGSADVAILMAPPSVREVIRIADAGETMPQKSTYFYPKVPTGLVLYRTSKS